MHKMYEATLHGNHLTWNDHAPDLLATDQPVTVQIMIPDSAFSASSDRGQKMADALNRIAQKGGLSNIGDPSAWQREIRQDRPLTGRDE